LNDLYRGGLPLNRRRVDGKSASYLFSVPMSDLKIDRIPLALLTCIKLTRARIWSCARETIENRNFFLWDKNRL
jgi:hypothetical protein